MAIVAGTMTFAQQDQTKNVESQKASSSSEGIRFGVKAGMNASTVTKAQDFDNKMKIGFNVGGFANIPISEKFSVQPEILYSGLGVKQEFYASNSDGAGYSYSAKGTSTTFLNYITIPVMLQYNLIPNLYVEAGPEFGFLLGGKGSGETTLTTTDNGITTVDVNNYSNKIPKDLYNKLNIGIGLGVGYYFTENIGVTARYVAGITDVHKDKPSGFKAIHNNVFQVGLAYKF